MVSLYRRSLRVIRLIEKQKDTNKTGLKDAVREEFERRKGIDKKNFARIEYLLRKGEKQLETLLNAKGGDSSEKKNPSMVTGIRFVPGSPKG